MTVESDFRRDFPGLGSRPRITTDGESFTIKNARLEDGGLYDVKIWRKDAQGNAITLKVGEGFPIDTILEVQTIVKAIFKKDVFDNFENKRLWFSDLGSLTCHEEDLAKDENENRKVSLIEGSCQNLADLARQNTPIPVHMAQIHQIFFHRSQLGCATDPDAESMVKATYESPTDWLKVVPKYHARDGESDESSERPVKRSRKKASTDSPVKGAADKTPEEVYPKSIRSKATSTDGAPVTSTPSSTTTTTPTEATVVDPSPISETNYKKGVINAMSATKEKEKVPAFMTGLTYRGLNEYSMNPQKGRYVKPYRHFVNLLKNPQSEDEGDQQMLGWLRSCYVKAYDFHLRNHAALFERNQESYDNDEAGFKDWCMDYAARAVVGFICVEEPMQKLVNELLHPSVSNF